MKSKHILLFMLVIVAAGIGSAVTFPLSEHFPPSEEPQNAVAILYFNDENLIGLDESGTANWTSIQATPTQVNCDVYNEDCADFDGGNKLFADRITSPSLSSSFDKESSIMFWFFLDDAETSEHDYIIAKNAEDGAKNRVYVFYNSAEQKIGVGIGANSDLMSCTPVLSEDTWNHIAISVNNTAGDDGIVTCHVNATQAGSTPYTDLYAFTEPFQLGSFSGDGEGFFGNVADLVILNRTLNYTDINQSYLGDFGGVSLPNNPPVISNINCTSCGSGDTSAPYSTTDTTPTFKFDTDIISDCRIGVMDQNFSMLGGTRDCAALGTNEHTCSLTVQDELVLPTEFVYIGCQSTSGGLQNSTSSSGALEIELNGLNATNDQAILDGVANSVISGSETVLSNQQVYLRDENDNQVLGRADKVVIKDNQRWVLNVAVDQEPIVGFFNMSPSVFVYDVGNRSTTQITKEVALLINETAQ